MKASSILDIDEITEEIKKAAQESTTEEDLRIKVEYVIKSKIIERIKELEKIEIPYAPWTPPAARYEVTLVSGVRADALYGHLIIEYEKPKTFESKNGFEHAIEQVKGYIIAHANGNEARFPRYFGIVLDGYKIGFVRYRETIKSFETKGPFEVNRDTVAKLVEAIIGLRRKALSAEELLKDFGPESQVTKDAIHTLYGKLLGTAPRTQMLFEDWKRVFSQVCAYSPEKIRGLEEFYGFKERKTNPEKLLFALHTYYALIMKLLAAEVAALYMAPKLWSYLRTLEDAYYKSHEELKEELRELEEGGIFTKLGITNFLEADYFSWYLDEWDENVAKKVVEVVNNLSNYDPSAAELEPDKVKDLFKRLYQNLVPKNIRHDLGEYYTPDWLAELVLNEVGWTLETFEKKAQEKKDYLAPLELRLLDPSCGSGTFLVLAISRLRSYVEEHWIDKRIALERIIKNVVGFDLNPLAVITSRTNYLIALGDMLRERGNDPIEIPIYLADSILVERRGTLKTVTYVLKTVVGEFMIPTSAVEKGLLAKVLSTIEECIRNKYQLDEFEARLSREAKLEEDEISVVLKLYSTLLKLEKENKNKIWTRVLKNSFAPFFAGKFDYVVGNPPWINWESLPEDYRNSTKKLWDEYGLLEKTKGMGLGKVKRDVSSLFLARCFDRYLTNGGSLSFLIPFTTLKTHASAGFRKFLATRSSTIKVHDLVELFPFEGAINRTSLICIKKYGKTSFPVSCTIWKKSIKENISTEASLNKVQKVTERYDAILAPIKRNDAGTPWMIISEKAYEVLQKVMKPAKYRAYAGVYTGVDGAYYVNILSKRGDNLLIQNMHETGKKKLKQVQSLVETDLVYPLVRGRDVKRWLFGYSSYIIIPTDERGQNIPIQTMKIEYPKAYGYFLNFEEELKERSIYKLIGEKQGIWYGLYVDIGNYTFAKYKVVWKNVAGKISGKAEFSAAVVGPVKDQFLGEKVAIPNVKLMFVPINDEDEAHYICAILNSSITRLIVASYVIETGISTHILQNVFVPTFDKKNKIHLELSSLSKKAHQLAQRNREDELEKIEEEIDRYVAQLYGITDEELEEIKRSLAILEGEEVEEEKHEEIPTLEPDITLENPIVEENTPSVLEIVIRNPLENVITNVKVKAQLPTETVERFFNSIEREEKIQVKVDGLKKGKYEIKLSMDYSFKDSSKKIQKSLSLFVRGKGEKETVKRKGIKEIFGEQ